jgi:glucose-6-phosphate 1-dehydrogenase
MLFWREDAVEACWAYFSPLIEGCEGCPTLDTLVHFYPAGTWGPEEARPILDRLVR